MAMSKETLEWRRPRRHPNAALSVRGWVNTKTNELLYNYRGGVPQALVDEVNGEVVPDELPANEPAPMMAMSSMVYEPEPDMNHLEFGTEEPEVEPELAIAPKPVVKARKKII